MDTWCEAMPLFLGVHFGIPELKISMKISILGCYCNFLKQLTNLRLFDASPPFFFKLKAYRNQQQGFFFFFDSPDFPGSDIFSFQLGKYCLAQKAQFPPVQANCRSQQSIDQGCAKRKKMTIWIWGCWEGIEFSTPK